jgi:hypothetical protein
MTSQHKLMPTEEMIEAMREYGPPILRGVSDCELREIYWGAEAARPTTDVSPEIDSALRSAHLASTKPIEILPGPTDVSTKGLKRLRALVAFMDLNRIAMLGAGEGHCIIANDLRSLIDAYEALQRSNAAKDEALRVVEAAMLRGGDGVVGDFGWNITKLNKARPLIRKALSHSSETSNG